MNKLVLLFASIFSITVNGQQHQNLIYNSGFERDGSGIKVTLSDCVNPYTSDTEGTSPSGCGTYNSIVDYWSEIYAWRCPQRRYSFCCGVGTADIRCNGNARSHLRHARGGNLELIVQPLREPLAPGHVYYAEIYSEVGVANPTNEEIGIGFYDGHEKQCGYTNITDHHTPELRIPQSRYTGEWEKSTFFYESTTDHKWIVIGGFGNGGHWGRMDDLRIFDLGTDYCADDEWHFQNTDLYSLIYQAGNKIIAGNDVTSFSYMEEGDVTIKNGESVIFKAGNSIILEPGFSTEPNSYFETIIEPCDGSNTHPCLFSNYQDKEYLICNGDPTVIGYSDQTGVQYQWSPSAYLDDPTSPSPTFTPPSGSGTITYTVTMSTICGGFLQSLFPFDIDPQVSHTVTVDYNSNPNPNPSISATNVVSDQYNIEFDLILAQGTETIEFELIDENGQTIFTDTYENDDEFNCCSFHWTDNLIPESFKEIFMTTCEDYTLKFTSFNQCVPNTSASVTVPWDRMGGGNPVIVNVTNVLTPNNDGSNDCIALIASNADKYRVHIHDRITSIYEYEGSITSSMTCIWTGECNTIHCSAPCVPNGTYYVEVEIWKKCNSGNLDYLAQSVTVFPYSNSNDCLSGSLMLTYGHESGMEISETVNADTEITDSSHSENHLSIAEQDHINSTQHNIRIYPNPANSSINIQTDFDGFQVQILDPTGKQVYKGLSEQTSHTVNVEDLASGMYIVHITPKSNSNTQVVRFIKK